MFALFVLETPQHVFLRFAPVVSFHPTLMSTCRRCWPWFWIEDRDQTEEMIPLMRKGVKHGGFVEMTLVVIFHVFIRNRA
jgi:hypothetical protein